MTEPPSGQDPNIGRVVADKYKIESVVGLGGAGTVYRATHLVLDRVIALKVLNPQLMANPTAKARFRREARAASRLDHPNSVQVFDYGIEPDGLTYLAMEFLEGRELFKVIYDDWPIAMDRVVKIMAQVLSVLAAAHEVGIVHRDLKPENIMLVNRPGDDGKPTEIVKVADFGIAKTFQGPVTEESLNLTRDGTVHGTPEYMSPEQARGEEVDGRADLYACGVILYEMLVGALPFSGQGAFDVILKQLTEPAPLPSLKRPGIDRRLEAVVMRALAKERDKRYPDARTMRAALLDAGAGAGPATPLGPRPPGRKPQLEVVPPLPGDDAPGDRRSLTPAPVEALPLVQYRTPYQGSAGAARTHDPEAITAPHSAAISERPPRHAAAESQPPPPSPPTEPPPPEELPPVQPRPQEDSGMVVLPGHSPLRNALVVAAVVLALGGIATVAYVMIRDVSRESDVPTASAAMDAGHEVAPIAVDAWSSNAVRADVTAPATRSPARAVRPRRARR